MWASPVGADARAGILAVRDNRGDSPGSLMHCRPACAACCTAPSISSPLPGLPNGKPAGVPCPHLDEALRCRLFGQAARPAVCGSLQPSQEMCGDSREQAMRWISALEQATR